MPTSPKKEVRKKIEDSLLDSLRKLEIPEPSRKAKKAIKKASKKLGDKLQVELKRKGKMEASANTRPKKTQRKTK